MKSMRLTAMLGRFLRRPVWRGLFALALFIGAPAAVPVWAQNGTGSEFLTDEILQGLKGAITQSPTTPLPSTQTQVPTRTSAPLLPRSAIEDSYSKRAGAELSQIGYDSFGFPASVTTRQTGRLDDAYILGAGDQVTVDIRGQVDQSYTVSVSRDGTVTLPDLQPVAAAGRRLGDFRRDLEERVREAYLATNAYISVGGVRQITVLVAGEVNAPGSIAVNALNSPLDAIFLAGGIKKTGSLRRITIQRGQETLTLDLYAALTSANLQLETALADGDRIVVPPIGATIAVAGTVARPGIYELPPGQEAVAVSDLMGLAGENIMGGATRLSALQVRPDGSEVMGPVGAGAALRKGDILFVQPRLDVARGRVVLEGQVTLPGTYDLARTPSLRALLGSPDIYEEEPFMLFAAISRRDETTLSRTIVPFSPIEVIQGRFDLQLQDDDIVRILSVTEARLLATQLAIEYEQRDPTGQDYRERVQTNLDREAAGYEPLSDNPDQRMEQLRGELETLQTQADSDGTSTDSSPTASRTPSTAQAATTAQSPESPQTTAAAQQGPALAVPPGSVPTATAPTVPGVAPTAPTVYPQQYPLPYTSYPHQVPPPVPLEEQPVTARNLRIDLTNPQIRRQIGNYRVSILGAVQVPGEYLAAPGVGLDALVATAGGLLITADISNLEITSTNLDRASGAAITNRVELNLQPGQMNLVRVRPLDVVRVREFYFDHEVGQVAIDGQVRFPGAFDILRGERLSSIIARAGGLTDIAYPYGAVFTRRSAAEAEEAGYRRAATELERQFTILVAEQNVSPQGVQFIRDTIDRLQTARGLGRVSIEADPVKLAANPEKDMILEPDDFLYMPRRPNSVSVTGEVLSPGSYLFDSGEGGRHYISLAGGYAQGADKGRTFIIMPDGTARSLDGSFASLRQSSRLVPGATIVVPRDLRPFRFGEFATQVTQVTSQLAVTAASIAVISRRN